MLAATVLLAATQTMTPLVALTATALIMGGTQHPLSVPPDSPDFVNGYVSDANNNYIAQTGLCGAGNAACTPVAVVTPEEFWPTFGTMTFDQSVAQGVTNLDQAIKAQPAGTSTVVFGYSQSARIATIEKRNLAAENSTLPVSFVLIGNPNRPNGGILERFEGTYIPILGVTFDGATPTDTNFQTVDITRQYDGWSDFPNNPLNVPADVNAVMGIYYVHGDYQSASLGDAVYQGQYGDTTYYLIPAERLPLLMPLAQAGVPDPALAVLDAPLRVLVETGYDRTISPGQPTPAMLLYFPNPVTTGVNLIVAIPTGLDDGAQEAVNIRPFGTPPPDQRSPYGVGGPPVDTGTVPGPATPAAAPAPKLAAPTGPMQGTATAATAPSIQAATLPKPPAAATTPLATPAQVARPAPPPAEIPKPAGPPAEIPKPAPPPVEMPKPAPPPVELPKPASPPFEIMKPPPAPVAIPKPVDIPKPAPPPVDIPAPAPIPAELPALPAPPALPPPPPMPAFQMPPLQLPAFRLPF